MKINQNRSYDFSGYATKIDLKCSDGTTIRRNAFKDDHGKKVPIVWQHLSSDPSNVIGHAILENREDGVYAYGSFNNSPKAQEAKELVAHGDIDSLSIYANRLTRRGGDIMHGNICEVSLVVAGANPGARIDNVVIRHADNSETESDDEGIIYSGEPFDIESDSEIAHADNTSTASKPESSKTVGEVWESLTDEQKTAMYAIVSEIISTENDQEDVSHSDGGDQMKFNPFIDGDNKQDEYISHSDMEVIIADAKRFGSLKESAIQHGITDIEYLFPEARTMNNPPDWIKRDTGWVRIVMNAVHKTPFSRIKSMFADITEDEARARGYIKGKLKKEEVFTLLKRTTNPQTVYKKQKLDRDDVIDITDFDVIAWIKSEMRLMLDEEIARAILVGDGRLASSDDKINEQNIRPVWTDEDLYTIKTAIAVNDSTTETQRAREFIKAVIKSRKNYKGSGNPTLFVSEDMLTDCLLIEDTTGRIIYDSVSKLATTLRVSSIVTVPVFENLTRQDSGDSKTHTLLGIIVNLDDYNVGADKGGAINMFDDFDIDYNQQKYLIETRCSGALIKPYSAIAIESVPAAG